MLVSGINRALCVHAWQEVGCGWLLTANYRDRDYSQFSVCLAPVMRFCPVNWSAVSAANPYSSLTHIGLVSVGKRRAVSCCSCFIFIIMVDWHIYQFYCLSNFHGCFWEVTPEFAQKLLMVVCDHHIFASPALPAFDIEDASISRKHCVSLVLRCKA